MKRIVEMALIIFNIAYLIATFGLGWYLFSTASGDPARIASGLMAFVLCLGESFYLIPRMKASYNDDFDHYKNNIGYGKLVSSISSIVFYLLLWKIGETFFVGTYFVHDIGIYFLAFLSVLLCMPRSNKWSEKNSPINWAVIRGLPFIAMVALSGYEFYLNRYAATEFNWMFIAIIISFVTYIILAATGDRYSKRDILTIPRAGANIWILVMCLQI